jgi:hypothetical protein
MKCKSEAIKEAKALYIVKNDIDIDYIVSNDHKIASELIKNMVALETAPRAIRYNHSSLLMGPQVTDMKCIDNIKFKDRVMTLVAEPMRKDRDKEVAELIKDRDKVKGIQLKDRDKNKGEMMMLRDPDKKGDELLLIRDPDKEDKLLLIKEPDKMGTRSLQ